jgi:hypothetical protein
MTIWEYAVERVFYSSPAGDIEQQLNQLGEDGWELVGWAATLSDTDERVFTAVLKRPKPTPPVSTANAPIQPTTRRG